MSTSPDRTLPKKPDGVIAYTAFMFMNETSWRLSSEIFLYFEKEKQQIVESDTATPVCKGTKSRADKA